MLENKEVLYKMKRVYVREHIPLNSINFETLKKSVCITAFSQEKRKHIFGGVV